MQITSRRIEENSVSISEVYDVDDLSSLNDVISIIEYVESQNIKIKMKEIVIVNYENYEMTFRELFHSLEELLARITEIDFTKVTYIDLNGNDEDVPAYISISFNQKYFSISHMKKEFISKLVRKE
jgi:hypothetical protein